MKIYDESRITAVLTIFNQLLPCLSLYESLLWACTTNVKCVIRKTAT